MVGMPDTTRPKEIIAQTFDVFCGPEQTMDTLGFAKFCESSKRVVASDANIIFSAVVHDAHYGMDLTEFKAALGLLVNIKKAGGCPDRESSSECFEVAAVDEVIKPARQISMGRRSSLENHSQNTTVGLKTKLKDPSSFRWSPLDIVDPINGGRPLDSPSRTIRWCPAELEE